MKKIITGMALLLVTTLSAFSQTKNITVSGRVVEDTKEPAIQATVQLLLLPDSVQASGTATTAQGYFTLPKVSAGKYVLKVSYIGFKSQYIPLHLYATTTAKNVGTLTLETDAVMLAEAVVTAEAPCSFRFPYRGRHGKLRGGPHPSQFLHRLRKGAVFHTHDQIHRPAIRTVPEIIPAVLLLENLEARGSVGTEGGTVHVIAAVPSGRLVTVMGEDVSQRD